MISRRELNPLECDHEFGDNALCLTCDIQGCQLCKNFVASHKIDNVEICEYCYCSGIERR